MMFYVLGVALALAFDLSAIYAQEPGPIVSTLSGDVQGRVMHDPQGRRYEEFLGIPFAQPPIGDFRFAKPEIPLPWSTVKDATDWGNACIQIVAPIHQIIGLSPESEDCLYINVHVPGGIDNIGDELKPVLVFIYGGAWYVGTSDMYPGQDLALNGDVIVVSYNYRLGAAGFLSTENSEAPGNWALWDGYYALMWINANIDRFGGDPDRITLMGQSAGAGSVSHHVNSPYSSGLFQRAIEISGSSGAFWASTAFAVENTRKLAITNLCPTYSDSALLDCMRRKDERYIDLMSLVAPVLLSGTFPNFVPVVDGDMVPQHPRSSIASGSSSNHDLLTGFTHDDGAGIIFLNPLGMGYGKLLNVANTRIGLRAILDIAMNVYENSGEMVQALYDQYPGMDDWDVDVRTRAACEMLTDFVFASQSYYEADSHALNSGSTGKRTWLYEYKYRASWFKYESWINGSHVDDLYTLFGEPFMETFMSRILREEWDDNDRMVRDHHQKYFANFVYTGNPNEGPHSVDVEWPQYTPDNKEYLVLSQYPVAQNMSLETERLDKYYFFTEVWPTLMIHRSPSNALNNVGKDIEKVKIALDSIFEGIDMAAVLSDPTTTFWIKFLGDLRNML